MSLRSKRHFCERIMCPLLRLVFLSLVTSGILVNMQILPSATYQHINQLEYDDFWTCGEQNCVWNITVQENHVVQLALTYDSVCDASLSDEYGLSCACSKLEAYDGFLISNQNVLVRTCDKYWSTFGLLTTVTNNIIIVYSGFAQSSVDDILSVTYKSFNTTAVNRTCGEKLTGLKGFFSSPGYPSNYTSLLVCEWIISANPGFTIHLTINEMRLESSVDCEYDSLQVRDGNTTFAPNLWFRCGDFNPVSSADYITSTGSAMYIRFVTNWSIERHGFTANWTTATCTRTNCSSVNGGCLNEQCYCNTGYYLNTTSKTCDLIVKNSTFSNATCTCNTQNTVSCNAVNGSCTCKAGWKGDSCDVDIDECLTSLTYPCTAHAQCINVNGSYLCPCAQGYVKTQNNSCQECPPNYYGDNCNQTCNCSSNTLVCDNVNGTCKCKAGWEGIQCEKDINECTKGLHNCTYDHVNCTNTNGSYRCDCVAGYVHSSNGSCTECLPNYYGDNCNQTCNCSNNTLVCDNVNGTCKCKAGWEGIQCEKDVNECTKGLHNCTYDHVNCTNTNGSYRCDCVAGYVHSSNGSCTECLPNYYGDNCNQTCNCSNNTLVCDNVNGTCKCKAGWEGIQCEKDVNECTKGLHNCTYDHVNCTNTNGSYRCDCVAGYVHSSNGSCTECLPNYYGDNCNQTCNCSSNTLVCDNVNGTCKCKAGWEGVQCEVDINECATGLHNCTTDYICINTNSSYRCECHVGYLLSNNGSCIECPPYKYGKDCVQNCSCSINTLSCDKVNGSCKCKAGWEGIHCDTDINECNTGLQNCTDNNAICVNTNGSYRCDCKPGRTMNGENICTELLSSRRP